MKFRSVPSTWDRLYLPEWQVSKTAPFWTCAVSLLYAFIGIAGLGRSLIRHTSRNTTPGLWLVASMIVVIVGLTLYFIHHVQSIRAVLPTLEPKAAQAIVQSARTGTRLFYSMMICVGVFTMVARMMFFEN